MGEVATMEARLTAIRASLNESRTLLDSCACRLSVKGQERKAATTTMSQFAADRVREQLQTEHSSPSLISMPQVVATGALRVDGVFTHTMPTRCSILGSPVKLGNNTTAVAFPTSGTTRLSAASLTGVRNGMMQGAGGSTVNTPTGCSAPVLNYPPDDPGALAPSVNSDMSRGPSCHVEEHPADRCPLRPETSFPHFNGDNSRLWRAKCLEFFKTFNINECMWVTAARLHMEGIAADWYHTHRLRQPIGDWSQFMKAVEAEFAVGDSKTHDTVEQQLSLREASMEGEVFPTVGGLSLFVEEGLGSTNVVCDAVLFEDVSGPDEVLTHEGGVSLFLELDLCSAEERLTESPTMLSVEVLVCDNTEDIVADTWFKDVLQRGDVEWKPCPPDVHVWISHNKAICRPRPWPSFACNQLKDVQMTFARLPRRTTYLVLPTEYLSMVKYLCSEGRGSLDWWWSQFSGKEQWLLHDVDLGTVAVCSSISAIRLSGHFDLEGSRDVRWVQNSNNFARTMRIHSMNLLPDFNVWDNSKSRIIATEICFQWDPGIIKNVLMHPMLVQLAQKSVYLFVLSIQVIQELCNYTIAGHASGYSMHNLLVDSISWLGGHGLVAELGGWQ
ncbi:hypothetical protein ACQ4PT_038327 [Festuca glaucescens]